jgi:hypothetical protein
MRNAVSGFRATDIEPFDPQLISEEDYMPAATDREIRPELQETAQAIKSPATYVESVPPDEGSSCVHLQSGMT